MMRLTSLLLLALGTSSISFGQIPMELVGKPVGSNPGFMHARSFNWVDDVFVGIDPQQYAGNELSGNIYICEHQSPGAWTGNPTLVDVRGSYQSHVFTGMSLGENLVELENTVGLPAMVGDRSGHGYDVIIDVNQDGQLDNGDYMDGWSYEEAGFYLVNNMDLPGPHDVDTLTYSSSFWNTFTIYHPADLDQMGPQPLVVISHGWTHEYWYYDYLGFHLASYGYIVMSHRNDVGDGGALETTTASQTALENIDEILENESTIGGGVLDGKIMHNAIIHTGHSTGGECVVRAYKRLYEGDYVSENFNHENIILVNSLAPVAFLDGSEVHPEGVNYHQFLCGADTDVSGAPVDAYVQAFSIYERGYGNKQVTYIHGAGHSDLHDDEDAWPWASGPDLIGTEAAHTVVRPYFLALVELYSRNNLAMRDFFTRNRNEFRPANIESFIDVSGEYKDAESLENMVIDDFQTNEALTESSSGAGVQTDLEELHELLMRDFDESFAWEGDNWANGMCRSRYDDNPRCAVMAWENQNKYLKFDLNEDMQDLSESEFLSFRACQVTRHPFNNEWDGEITFDITLEDVNGNTGTVNSGNYGGIAPPYPKGAGGYIAICLEEGTYTVECGGSNWESEMSFEIPGYLSEGAGTFELVIGPGDPCTDIEVFMYDSWGDGWDAGLLQIINENEEVVAEGTLVDGSEPSLFGGWQNEFHIMRMRLSDFTAGENGVDLSQITAVTFEFGPDHTSPLGAIGLDDLQFTGKGLSYVGTVDKPNIESGLRVYPNPLVDQCYLNIGQEGISWRYRLYDNAGKLVRESGWIQNSFTVIDRDELESGIYAVEAVGENFRDVTRLVVE